MKHTNVNSDFNCNWLGGQVVADEIAAPGYSDAGFVNITTSDGIVHGQVRQSGLFSFVRIYESGHEVPFYQPLAALTLFERALDQKDIATGKKSIHGYKSKGTPTTTYREGNGTIQMDVLPSNASYNTALNGPDPTPTPFRAKRADLPETKKPRKETRKLGRLVKSKDRKRQVNKMFQGIL